MPLNSPDGSTVQRAVGEVFWVTELLVCRTGYRERTRTTVRHIEDPNLPCPHLHEYQSCEYPLCYSWKTTPSSPCRLKYPDMQCGEGMRNRTVECVSVLGVRLYDLSFFTYLVTCPWLICY